MGTASAMAMVMAKGGSDNVSNGNGDSNDYYDGESNEYGNSDGHFPHLPQKKRGVTPHLPNHIQYPLQGAQSSLLCKLAK